MEGIGSISGELFVSQESNVFEDDREEKLVRNLSFWTSRESGTSLRDRCKVQPVMARPPDKAKVDLRGGEDEVRGVFIEGGISLEWGDQSRESSQPKRDPDNSGHDISSTDKN